MEPKTMYRVAYRYGNQFISDQFSDIFLLTNDEVKLAEAQMAQAQESRDLVDWSIFPTELADYNDLLDSFENNDVPELGVRE